MTHLLLIIIYIAFISLGLPDSLLGSAWPSIYPEFQVPVSYAGIISMIIAFGTIVSSLQSDRLTLKLGTGKVTAISVAMTAIALFGFSISHSFIALCLWSIPYGLGAGSVDASLNNYVALHYKSKHMSWLHCMWGLGASAGPYIMGFALTNNLGWNSGYRIISIMQVVLTAVLIFSLPLWKNRSDSTINSSESENSTQNIANKTTNSTNDTASKKDDFSDNTITNEANGQRKPLSLRDIIAIPGAKAIMLSFFCYCAIESTTGLWAASYLNLYKGVSAETAASFASMFYLGITIGRGLSGFITMKLDDTKMVRLGICIIFLGVIAMFIPGSEIISLIGLILIGLGCAPIYPCLIHSTPERFGADKSQAIIGVQMASAYVGTCIMPPIFGLIANSINIALLPVYLIIILVLMFFMFNKLTKITVAN